MHPGETLHIAYEVEEVVHQDGVGSTFVGRNTHTGHPVSIRVVDERLAVDREAGLCFFQEALYASRLDPKHIAAVHDMGWTADGRAFVVSEHFHRSRTAADTLRSQGPFAISRVAKIGLQACKALSAAHGAGLIHGRITPSCLLLIERNDESEESVRVGDFGVNALWASLGSTAVLDAPDIASLAPEIRRHSSAIDRRADVYALAAVLYELLTGVPPVTLLGNELDHFEEQLTRPDPAWQLRSEIPEELSELIERALEPELEARLSSVDELARALTAFVTSTVIEADELRMTEVLAHSPATVPARELAPSSIPAEQVSDVDVLAAMTIPPPHEKETTTVPATEGREDAPELKRPTELDSSPPQVQTQPAPGPPVQEKPPQNSESQPARKQGPKDRKPRSKGKSSGRLRMTGLITALVLCIAGGSALGAAVITRTDAELTTPTERPSPPPAPVPAPASEPKRARLALDTIRAAKSVPSAGTGAIPALEPTAIEPTPVIAPTTIEAPPTQAETEEQEPATEEARPNNRESVEKARRQLGNSNARGCLRTLGKVPFSSQALALKIRCYEAAGQHDRACSLATRHKSDTYSSVWSRINCR